MNSIEDAIRTPLYKKSLSNGEIHIVSDYSTNNTRMLMPISIGSKKFLYEAILLGNANGNTVFCYLIGDQQNKLLLATNNTFDIKVKLIDPAEGVNEFLPLPSDSNDIAREKTAKCIEIVIKNKQHNFNKVKQVFNKFTEFVNALYG